MKASRARSKARQATARGLRAAMSGGRVGFIDVRAGVRTRPWALLNGTVALPDDLV
jgi:hypothetical protein